MFKFTPTKQWLDNAVRLEESMTSLLVERIRNLLVGSDDGASVEAALLECVEATEHVLTVLEAPGTSDDDYDENDWVGAGVLHGRRTLASLECAVEELEKARA